MLGIELSTFRSYYLRDLKDSLIVTYTDGATEFGHDPVRGEEVLQSVIADLSPAGPRPAFEIYKRIFAENPPLDDVAILTLAFSAD